MHRSDRANARPAAAAWSKACDHEQLDPWERADLAIDSVVGVDEDVWAARSVIASKRRRRLEDVGTTDQFQHADEVPDEDIARRPRFPQRLKFGLNIDEHGAIGLWTTSNQRRALASYATDEMSHFSIKDYLGERDLTDLVERCHEVCRSAYAARGQTFEGEFLIVRQQAIVAATARKLLTQIFDYCGSTSVVIGTQHATLPRAAIVAARGLNVPSVYVPHAPFASNRLYYDLPADWAGLWGDAERDMYVSLGADDGRISVVGTAMHDLGLSTAGAKWHKHEGRPLVAPSAWKDDRLAYFLQACSVALPGSFAIAPHPRNSLDVIHEFAAKRATVLQGVSAGHLESAQPLIQCYSGIALEGLLAGVPVINFNPFGVRSNYPLVREPYVPHCTTADELRREVERQVGDPGRVLSNSRRDWARSWCAYSGPEAGDRLRSLVRHAEPKRQSVLDGWSMSDA